MWRIGIPIFVGMSQREFTYSKAFCEPLTRKIVAQDQRYLNNTHQSSEIRKTIVKSREQGNKTKLEQIRSEMNKEQLRANDLLQKSKEHQAG